VLHTLFDDPKYTKVQKRGNRKEGSNSAEEERTSEQVNHGLNYGDPNRPFIGGPNHAELQVTLVRLFISLPFFDLYILYYDIGTS
jgi:TRIAD3 protein (E3 ubiquitin-protein ligase RNF216)